MEEQFPVPRYTATSKIGDSVIPLLWQLWCRCNPDHNKFSSLSNTTVWWQLFQILVYGDVVYAQTCEVLTLKNCIEPPGKFLVLTLYSCKTRQRNVQKSMLHVQILLIRPMGFFRCSRCCRRLALHDFIFRLSKLLILTRALLLALANVYITWLWGRGI